MRYNLFYFSTSLNKKWTEIGLELYTRSTGIFVKKPKSIRERWLSHLNPTVKKYITHNHRDDWDLKQDIRLFKMIKEKGRKWSKIAKAFGNRTQHAVKNRYNQLVSKFEREAKSENISFHLQTEEKKINLIEKQLLKL